MKNNGMAGISLLIMVSVLGGVLINTRIQMRKNEYIAEQKVILAIHSIAVKKYNYLWDNMSQQYKDKFINLSNLRTFMQNKYGETHFKIASIKNPYTKKNIIYIPVKLLFETNNNNYTIPNYYNNNYFNFEINEKNQKIVNFGQFDISSSPIIIIKNVRLKTMDIPILMLHKVVPTYSPESEYVNKYGYELDMGLTLLTNEFKSQLEYLKKTGYTTVTLENIFNNIYYRTLLPKKPIILSFDDGRESQYKYAFPILKNFGDIAEFNIITGFVGGYNGVAMSYMTWNQIHQLSDTGMEIESHTVNHIALGGANAKYINYELSVSKQTLEQKLGTVVQFIAYPSGAPFRNEDMQGEEILKKDLLQNGYIGGLLDENFNSQKQNMSDPYMLYRIRDSGNISMKQFISNLKV